MKVVRAVASDRGVRSEALTAVIDGGMVTVCDDDDKLTRCGECGELYTAPPAMLSCLHTFCLPCLRRFNVSYVKQSLVAL